MHKFLLYLIIVGISSCQSGLKKVVLYHDDGSVYEQYYVTKEELKKQGEYRRYYQNGTLEELAHFEDDKLTEERTFYSLEGAIIIKENHKNDAYHGLYLSYFDNGKIEQKGNYLENAMNGIWETFYQDGQLKESVTFANNEENGPFNEYYEDGVLKATGEYKDGDNEQGLLVLYDSTGTVIRKMNCIMGKCNTIPQ